jgi:DNA polymerase III epsilon subunit-like protein
MAKYDNKFIGVDFETGGLIGKGKEATIDIAITEVALVIVDSESLKITEKHSWLVKPYDDNLVYSPAAEKVSGISKKMCEDKGVDLEVVYKNICEVLKDNKMGSKKPIIVMQNKKFDTPFMKNMFLIFSDEFAKYIDRIEDTMEWSRIKWPEEGKHSLATIAERCGLEHVASHRAESDAIVTMKIWIHFMKSLRGSIGGNVEKKEENTNRGEGFSL